MTSRATISVPPCHKWAMWWATVSPRKTRLTVLCVYRSRWAWFAWFAPTAWPQWKKRWTWEKALASGECRWHSWRWCAGYCTRQAGQSYWRLRSPRQRCDWWGARAEHPRKLHQVGSDLRQAAREHRSHLVESDSQRRSWPEPLQPEQRRDSALTHEVADTRFELSNRVTNNVLKRLDLASTNKNRLEKLLKPIKTEEAEVLVTEA